MANIKGNISNPISVNGKVVTENEVRTEVDINLNMNYLASSVSPSLFTVNKAYFMDDLSQVKNLIFKPVPASMGNTVLTNTTINKLCFFNYELDDNGNIINENIFDNIPMQYIDNGKTYEHYGAISEKKIYLGWEPVSNEYKYSHEERSDIYGFDYPQFTPRGTRKIPILDSNDTLCGPITYDGNNYTYDRLNYNWIFGQRAGISFDPIKSGATPVVITGAVVSQEGCSSISNEEGNLLFYTDGNTVFTSGNTIMRDGTNLSSSGTSTQSSLIVPRPYTNQYYIFTTDYEGNPNGFEYSLVDMDRVGGDGKIIFKNLPLIEHPVTEKVTACSHFNEVDYWVITHTSGDSKFYSYRVSNGGISSAVVSNTGTTHNTGRGYMKTSPDSSKLVSLLYDENIIQVLDFNNTGGTISNEIVISGDTFFINGPYGLEFSSDSSKFYVSDGASNKIIQYDLAYTSSTEMRENSIIVAELPLSSSLGALQMGPDEKIYAADYLKDYLHVIHRPNGLGVQCNFKPQSFSLTGISSGVTSTWGLPNIITSKSLSCDRYVYISERNRTPFEFDLILNDVSNVIQPNQLNFTAEIYSFDCERGVFSDNPLLVKEYEYTIFSGESGTTLTIPLDEISEGEFLIKGYFEYPIKTLIQKELGRRRNSVNNYKRGSEYNLYNPETDWYFLNLFEADAATFVNQPGEPQNISNLKVTSFQTELGDTKFFYKSSSDPLVSYNGVIQSKNVEYSANTDTPDGFYIEFFTPTLADRMVTLAFVQDGDANELSLDNYTVTTPISSGSTGQQTREDKLYFNTTHNTYEYYLPVDAIGDIGLSLNGNQLSSNIEYMRSDTDSRRIIILVDLKKGDLIQVFFNPVSGIFGRVETNKPELTWVIPNAPTICEEGIFTIEVTDVNDHEFKEIKYIATTPYVVGQNNYSLVIDLSDAVAGDKLIYRVKNQKLYTPIVGEIITSVTYSTTVPIEIVTNRGNIY